MRPADLDGARRLSDQAGWNQTAADWARLLAWEPDGCVLLEAGGDVVGTVTTTRYGRDLAWIGMLLVEQGRRRQGLARRLLAEALARLRADGVGAALLDATPLGRPLYEQLGFREVAGLERRQGIGAPAPAGAAAPAVRTLRPGDLPALASLDGAAFGAPRGRILRDLAAAPGALGYVTGAGDRIDGYALVRPGAHHWYIGPLVARSPAAAAALLDAALSALRGRPVALDVPLSNPWAAALVAARGLALARPFTRMALGGVAPGTHAGLGYAVAGPEIG